MLLCRVFKGLAEAFAFSGVYYFLFSYIFSHDRTCSTALFLTGTNVGSTLALIVFSIIIDYVLWRLFLYYFSSVDFAWIFALQLIAYGREDPSE